MGMDPSRTTTARDAPPSTFLFVREVADRFRINTKTVHKVLASGELHHVRRGWVIRIPGSVLRQ
jgi:hypothetical protein